ncbi:peptidoglycan-binding protein [Streptomyces bottropensis]|uniref:peptidoglycan-binding protein n=1 Tax=Streptomyces bottropensis TaxID=42235 RepID=UPI00368607BB
MTEYHVAVDHLASPDPNTPEQRVETTYLGVVDQAHVDEVRAIAALDNTERWVKEHPRLEGAFMVLRDDGDLDVYVPTDAAEYRVYEPDLNAKTTGLEDLPRGAAGPAYIAGAVRFGGQAIGGAMDSPNKPPRTVWHTTESPAGGNYFASIAAYLIRAGAEPQVIYCPATDRLGQFGPLTQSGRALRNDGAYRVNRTGKVCIQVEVLGYAKSPWTTGFDPAKKPNYRKLIAAARAHGVPDVWPVGKPPATAAAATRRPKETWENKGGNYGHSQIRGQNHWDPGGIDTSIVPGKPATPPADPGEGTVTQPGTGTYKVKDGDTLTSIAKANGTTVAKLTSLNTLADPDKLTPGQVLKVPAKKPAAPLYEPFPGKEFFHGGRHSKVITMLGMRLVALGFGEYYKFGPSPNWTNADRRAVAAFQRSRSELAGDADGIPGPKTWAALKVPKV